MGMFVMLSRTLRSPRRYFPAFAGGLAAACGPGEPRTDAERLARGKEVVALVKGEDGYARVGPRGAVVVGEEGYAARGWRGVVVGERDKSYDAWRVVAGVGAAIASGRCWRGRPGPR
jgi:hypothetical protein